MPRLASQTLSTLCGGITRHQSASPWFRRHAHGFKEAAAWRDVGHPIPRGDQARTLIAESYRLIAQQQ
ncbi:MAG: hypothetical protein RLW62_05435 [Gammaproteobacteria bacterium]